MMASIDQTIVATALPALREDLGAPITWSGWTITIYALGQVVVMPLAGKLSDLYGAKRIFLGAAMLFGVASLLCGLAGNIYLLVALRAVQAIGGGAFMPAASGMVARQFGRNRGRALGLFTSIFPIGGVIGPVLGGIIVTYSSWRVIFLVNVPLCVVLISLGLIFFPAHTPRQAGARIDAAGAGLLAGALLGIMFAITELGETGSVLSPRVLLPSVAGLAALTLFLRHAKRADDPFVSTRLLVGRGFGTMNVINFLYGAAALGFSAFVPLYALDRYGIQPLEAGTLLTARAVGMICVAGLAVLALRRTGYRLPMGMGLATIVVGLVMTVIPAQYGSPYSWLAVASALTGLGMGMSAPAANNATLRFAHGQIAGVAGLRGMFRQAGAITSISIATAAMAQSSDPGRTLGIAFLALAACLVLVLPLVFRVPEDG